MNVRKLLIVSLKSCFCAVQNGIWCKNGVQKFLFYYVLSYTFVPKKYFTQLSQVSLTLYLLGVKRS
jgi:hypothetical protein